MCDFIPALVAELTPLLHAAGLHSLDIEANYSARNGWNYAAGAYCGKAYLSLVAVPGAFSEAQLRTALENALLDQLSAYYANAVQL